MLSLNKQLFFVTLDTKETKGNKIKILNNTIR